MKLTLSNLFCLYFTKRNNWGGGANGKTKSIIKSNLFFEDARQIRYDNIAYSRTSSGKHGKARKLKTYKIISIIDEINFVIPVWP